MRPDATPTDPLTDLLGSLAKNTRLENEQVALVCEKLRLRRVEKALYINSWIVLIVIVAICIAYAYQEHSLLPIISITIGLAAGRLTAACTFARQLKRFRGLKEFERQLKNPESEDHEPPAEPTAARLMRDDKGGPSPRLLDLALALRDLGGITAADRELLYKLAEMETTQNRDLRRAEFYYRLSVAITTITMLACILTAILIHSPWPAVGNAVGVNAGAWFSNYALKRRDRQRAKVAAELRTRFRAGEYKA
jgi:hypothetical protein